jgi:hypothetical protein
MTDEQKKENIKISYQINKEKLRSYQNQYRERRDGPKNVKRKLTEEEKKKHRVDYQREYYRKHREEVLQYQKMYRSKNGNDYKEYQRMYHSQWNKENPEKVKGNLKRYYERTSETRREKSIKWYEENRERVIGLRKIYYEKRREEIRKYKSEWYYLKKSR